MGEEARQGCPERPRSERPAGLGFRPLPMVRWLDPGPIAARELKGRISGLFGSHADRREIEAALSPPADLDYSGEGEIWFDYAADVGDGFDSTYTMATVLARDRLDIEVEGGQSSTPRGRFLVLGGDAVYPAADEELYRDRFLGPYRAALPCAPEESHPHLFAVPGNHDWYDGLTSFLRIFCQGLWVGGWRTRQTRSYFAIELPHRWWLWAIDIQFDRFIDEPQLAYFRQQARDRLQPGDRIILCTAKPSWVHAGLGGDHRYTGSLQAPRNLEYFERTVIHETGARLVLTLSGDLHHYARYGNGDDSRQKITSGGGGAYLYPTHLLPARVSWPEASGQETYSLRTTFPSPQRSRALRWGCLLVPFKNPGFWTMAGALHLLFAWFAQFALQSAGGAAGATVAATMRGASFWDVVSAVLRYPPGLLLAAVLVAALVGFADVPAGIRRWLAGSLHGAGHLALIVFAIWAASRVRLGGAPFLAAFLASVAFLGGLAAGLLMGVYLLVTNLLFQAHPNEVFAAQHIEDHKNFLRLRIGPDGALTIYPIGVERICRQWRLRADGEPGDPWFEPAERIAPRLVEPPIRLENRF